MEFIITDRAARALGQTLEEKMAGPGTGLRLGVQRGGCAGWQYTMQITEAAADDVPVTSSEAPVFIAAD